MFTPGYSHQEINKIGNTLIYLHNKLSSLSKTQALKFLYLLDEFSIKKYGIPFVGLKYEVWQYGPVAQDIFVELTDEQPKMLKDFIKIKREGALQYQYLNLIPTKDFCDDEFSDNDIALMDLLISKFRSFSASEISEYTHKPNTLWFNIAKENNLIEPFKQNRIRTSNHIIDFTKLLDEKKEGIYIHHLENQEITRQYSN